MAHFKNILLVDDDPINNLINKRILSKVELGEDIHEFLSGGEALKKLESLSQGDGDVLLFLDINMPLMNGWEFLDHYNELFPERNDRIIILSSSIDFQDRIKSQEYDVVSGFLEKPLTIDKIQNHFDSLTR
ncbi:response regulator [Algoriphagus namhaensis]